MSGLTRVVLIACLFGVLQGATWVAEGQHTLRMIGAVQSDRLDAPGTKPLEVMEMAMMALGHAAAPGASSEAETDAHQQIREGLWLLGGSLIVAAAAFALQRRSRPPRPLPRRPH